MTRKAFQYRAYSVVPDDAPGAEPAAYSMSCAVCGSSGPKSEDALQGSEWVTVHLKAHPDHLAYREHITRPYRAVPGEWL